MTLDLGEGVRLVSFGILTLMVLGGALGVVLAPSMVHSAFLLGGVFIGMSGLFVLLNADFVAAAQILIYVGAVNVLLLFAIMLVNRRESTSPLEKKRTLRTIVSAVVSVSVFGLLANAMLGANWQLSSERPIENSTLQLGIQFFSNFLLPFELVSVLLLVALIGAIILARREFVPDQTESGDEPLVLPERPREGLDKQLPASRR